MALSNGYDTVSSWLQPPSAAVIAADEKLKMSNQEFEKLAFRPAREKKRKKKKKQKKSTEDDHGSKSKLRPSPSSGGDGNKGEDQGDWEDDGEEWSGIPPSQPPPGSDMGPPPPPKPPKPTSAPSPDLKSTTVSDSRINHDRPPRPPKPPRTPATQLTTRSTSSIPSSSRSSGSIISSPPQNGRTGVGSHPLTSSSLPTLPNGDSSSPHKKKKKRRRALLDQAQALDEQSSEATLVSSSDHTARMTSPRE
ncbi:hypothetical protein FRC01_004645 [Tulasnella sp. 417]|nr:hypothetical protein FRC01_004645 [Tulasnella sp. 417]